MRRVGIMLIALSLAGEVRAATRRTAGIVAEANQDFAAGRFEQALEKYTRAQVEDPQNPVIQYNLGNALYKLGRYEEAQRAYDALAKSSGGEQPPVDLGRDAAYNQGDSYFQAQKYKEALDQYQRALELDSADKDAKHNLELARLKLQQPPPPPEPKPQEPEEKQDDKDSEDKSEPPPQPSPTPSPGATPQPKPGEMSKEEAERLLDALDRAERDERKADKEPAAREGEAIDW